MAASLKGLIYRSRAPLRLSFGGGGSEIPPYVEEYGGVVLNVTIARYVYATIVAQQDTVTFTAADLGLTETLPLAAYYPLEGALLPLHRAVYNRIISTYNGGRPIGLHLHTNAQAPIGSGLGTSSTLSVAMVRCFQEAFGLTLDEYDLAALAHDIERVDLNLSGGYQDHYSASFGGFNFIDFRANGDVVVHPLRIRLPVRAELEYALVLYFTGVSRDSGRIVDEQIHAIQSKEATVQSIHTIKSLAYQMKDYLLKGQLADFARTMHESWSVKRSTSTAISNQAIDSLYEQALASGALGGKISGAGGGGFMMLIVEPVKRHQVMSSLPGAQDQDTFCRFEESGAVAWQTRW